MSPCRSKFLRLYVVLSMATLAGCGGGGGSDEPPDSTPPSNLPPIARAGADQVVSETSAVVLQGGASSDPDGTIAGYQWAQMSGPAVSISGSSQAEASFLAPLVSSDTLLEFRLTVTDDSNESASEDVTITVLPETFTLSGTVSATEGTIADSDVNDPNADYAPNDSAVLAQPISNPITVGGYINVLGTGAPGPSFDRGDVSDYYRVSLLAGESITLFVSDPDLGDPDLYLWDASGSNIVDFSVNIGSVESLVVPFSGDFLVEAYAFAGASNYVLAIGQAQVTSASTGFRLSDEFVPGEMIVHQGRAAQGKGKAATHSAIESLGLKKRSGGIERPMLFVLDDSSSRPTIGHQKTTVKVDRFEALASVEEQRKYQTLLAIKTLNGEPHVDYAQPNYVLEPTAIPNDEFYPLQWHYPAINLPAAWDITTGDPSVTVAVLDTGVLLNHPDMQTQLVPGFDFVSNPLIGADADGIDANPDDPGDANGTQPSTFHGTHVAATIGASSNNGSGVAGVAWNVRIMPIRVLGVGGGTTYDIIQGLRYAAGQSNDSGQVANPVVDVVNLSLGGSGPCDPATQEMLNLARQAGVVVVVAAGNDNTNAAGFSPASCNGIITVSAVAIDNVRAPYSNFGFPIDVAAPGGNLGTDLNGDGYADGVLSAAGDDSSGSIAFAYPFSQGTSMASPHVAGVIALMRSVNPGITPDQIDQLLANGELTDEIGDPDLYGNGLINARKSVAAALSALGAPPPVTPFLAVTPESLNFGASSTSGSFTAQNAVAGSLHVTSVTDNVSWLNVVPVNVSGEGLGSYAVLVDRGGLATGTYSGTITIQSDVNVVGMPVIMQVADRTIEPDAGFLYTLLIDSDTGEVVEQFAAAAVDGKYEYQFSDVADGRYEIVSGSDSDNDFFICDAGETCGGYLTMYQPVVLEVAEDMDELHFSVGHVVAIPAQSLDVTSGGYTRSPKLWRYPEQ